MSPANTKPVRAWEADRHIDINGDLHLFFDWLVAGKKVLDIGAGLGKSKVRIRHNRVMTYDPSRAAQVDTHHLPGHAVDVVTAFEVIEHIHDDVEFLHRLDALATQALFLTTPSWAIQQCQSMDHYREYTHAEWEALISMVWPHPHARFWWGAYYKDAEGGYCHLHTPEVFRRHQGLKHLVLVDKKLSDRDRRWLTKLQARSLAFGGH